MTPRQLLFAFLRNEPTDRVPIWMLFPYDRVPYYADVHALPAYRPVVDLALEKCVWLNRRNFRTPLFTPEVETRTVEEAGVIRREYRYRDLLLVEERYPDSHRKAKKMLSSEEDLETFAAFPFETDARAIHAALDERLGPWHAEAAAFPAHLGAMMSDVGEPIGVVHGLADVEELSIWSLTMPEVVEQILARQLEAFLIAYRYLLEQNAGEVFFLVGSELAAPPLVSLETFQRWIVPYSQAIIKLIHEYDKHVIQHFHGQIKELLPDFLTMAPDALHTIEAPPIGNCTFTQAFDIVGDKIGLIGNIQYDEFQRLTPEEMDAAVRDCLDECRGQRFMLSPTAGPYEHAPTPRVLENFRHFIRAGWEYGES